MRYCIVTATNDRRTLHSTLLSSPDLHTEVAVVVQENAPSAAIAYNQGMESLCADTYILVHQDVYLPSGWFQKLEMALNCIQEIDPNWGVLGLFGMTHSGTATGWIYSTGLAAILGGSFEGVRSVRTLDEVMLVIRGGSGLRFDTRLRGFHMYGTDICLEAENRGMKNYVVPCFAIHNSNGIRQLPWAFWRACAFIRRKWSHKLPIYAPCTIVDRLPFYTIKQMISRFVRFYLRKDEIGGRVDNPAELYAALVRSDATLN